MPRAATAPLCWLLLAATVVAYAPLRHNDFVDFDDVAYITANVHVLQGFTADSFTWAWTTLHGGYWQPLSWLSLQWDAHWFAASAADGAPVPSALAFHLQSLCWHLASALSLFCLCRRLTATLCQSFLVAALFALHPLRVESVAWAAERKDVLCVFFGLLALHAYVWYCARPSSRRYLALAATSAASLMCKPMLMTLPAVLLLLDIWPLRRCRLFRSTPDTESPAPEPWRLLAEKVPLVLLSAAVGVLTIVARAEAHAAMPLEVLPLSQRLANVPVGYAWYVTRTIYPTGLCVLYPHPGRNWSLVAVLVSTAFLVSVTGIAVWQARRRPWLLVGWLWFAGTLLPVSGLAQGGEQACADRFSYWPQIGLLLAIVWGCAECMQRWSLPFNVRAGLGGAALAVCGVLTWQQLGSWRDPETLWQRTLSVTERNARAHLHLGKWYLDRSDLASALPHFEATARLRPTAGLAHFCLGLTQLLLGETERAVDEFQAAVRLKAADTDAWHNLGIARLHQGRPQMAVPCFRKVLELGPEQWDARTELGRALWRCGKRDEAMACFQQALAGNTRQPFAWEGMGWDHLARGESDQAVHALGRAVELLPDNPSLCSELGIALGRERRWREAVLCQVRAIEMQTAREVKLAQLNGRVPEPEGIAPLVLYQCRLARVLNAVGDRRGSAALYQSAAERVPDWPRRFTARAWRLATDPVLRDPHMARELAVQAIEGSAGRPSAEALNALAASQAALGRYAEAIQTARQALAVTGAASDAAIAEAIREHLGHYEKGEPVTTQPH